jgi:hypothetical protein
MECEAYRKKEKNGEPWTIQIYFRRETRSPQKQRILWYYPRKKAKLLAVQKGKLHESREGRE